ncbi:MAG: hypothetical protein WCE81_10215 [Halobacteriota archaeon]
MDNNVQQLIEKLKQGAVDRCRERVLKAAEKSTTTMNKVEYISPTWGFTSHFKRDHGL